MVPVEPISLTIGVAALFSTCIECFEYLKAAQALEDDLEILLVKLDLEKTRLLIWGNAVGVLKDATEERAPGLGDSVKVESISKCLKCIKSLLSDADKLQKEYGVQAAQIAEGKRSKNVDFVSSNSMSVFKTSYKRFWVRHSSEKNKVGLLSKTKWAIHKKPEFEGLIVHLRGFIDGLYQVIPVSRASQDRLVQEDIASILDLSKLHLVKEACEEASYRAWSEMASVVIDESVRGTRDRRNYEERMQDVEGAKYVQGGDDFEELNVSATFLNGWVSPLYKSTKRTCIDHNAEPFEDTLSPATHVWFVLTDDCLNLQSEMPCEPSRLGRLVFGGNNFSLTPDTSNGSPRNIVRRISNAALIGRDRYYLETKKAYIYCAPCVRHIHTAISICRETPAKAFEFVLRPDGRLTASCCPEAGGVGGLQSLIDMCKEAEILPASISSSRKKDLYYFDRVWIEQQIFELEDGIPPQTSSPPQDARHLLEQHPWDDKCVAIVILGEIGHSVQMMGAAPFPQNPRMPKVTQIYQLKKTDSTPWERKYFGTYTPSNFKRNNSDDMSSVPLVTRTSLGAAPSISPSLRRSSSSPGPEPLRKRRRTSPPGRRNYDSGDEMEE